MSGVGKSTLVNALLGRSAQRVADVREISATRAGATRRPTASYFARRAGPC